MSEVRENRLFLGNPGTGKSTLVNCLIGQQIFESGLTWGGGLTQDYQKKIVGDIAYMDTPGLADRTILQQAARAITKALSEPGSYKLFFMVRLQAGRVVSDDLVTIERVLDSINGDTIPFSILINNLSPRQYKTMMRLGEEFNQVAALINCGKYKTPYIFFIPKFDDLDEMDNEIMQLPDEVHHFIEHRAPQVFISKDAVSEINLESFQQQAEALKDELAALRNDQARMVEVLMLMQMRHEDEIRREREFHQNNVDYLRYCQHMGYHPAQRKDNSKCAIM